VRTDPETGGLMISVAVPLQRYRQVLGAIMLSTSSGEIEDELRTVRLELIRIFGATLFVTVLLSMYLASTIAQPIRRLAAAAQRARGRGTRINKRTCHITIVVESVVAATPGRTAKAAPAKAAPAKAAPVKATAAEADNDAADTSTEAAPTTATKASKAAKTTKAAKAAAEPVDTTEASDTASEAKPAKKAAKKAPADGGAEPTATTDGAAEEGTE